MWQLERSNINKEHLTKAMKELYDRVDVLIQNGELLYETFANDMIDAITTVIVKNGKEGVEQDRIEQVDAICNELLNKYEELDKGESVEGDLGVSVDSTEVQDELGLCESASTSEAC
nr:MAG TPA: hypothetical protein [Caudoviricetes sp.]